METVKYEVNVKFDEDQKPSEEFSSNNLTFIGAIINTLLACWKLRKVVDKKLDYISIDRQIIKIDNSAVKK